MDDNTELDNRVSTLLHDTTAQLEPDVPGLIRGGIDRGRAKRRRHNVGTILAAAATIGIIGGAATVATNLSPRDAGLDPVGASAPATVPATSTTAPPKPTQPKRRPTQQPTNPTANIPVKAADLPHLFTKLYPGKVTPAEKRTGRIGDDGTSGQYAHFLWNGYLTTIGFMAYSGTPAQGCRQLQPDANQTHQSTETCQTLPDGTVLMQGQDRGTSRDDSDVPVGNHVLLFTKDGYAIFALSYNYANKTGPFLAEEPPLSTTQLTRAVTSNVWF